MSAVEWDRFVVRAATRRDAEGLQRLARHLNSVNLPDNSDAIAELVDISERSFEGSITEPLRRQYVLVVEDLARSEVVGTSMVLARLGSREAPYIYFDVRREEKYSATLDKHFAHTVLSTTYSYDGPTELGGLVVDPRYRGRPERVGLLASYARFLLVATRRSDFRDELLAELLPPFEPDGSSLLWEAVGRRFTGLSYQHADKLSSSNKDFIRDLFPARIYATLLAPEAQGVIGQVGPATLGVAKMLTRLGFQYAERVDPFDGGPHYLATTEEVPLVRGTRACHYGEAIEAEPGARFCLLAQHKDRPPYFTARPVPVHDASRQALWPSDTLLLQQGFQPDAPFALAPCC